jgi:hypothetical protein
MMIEYPNKKLQEFQPMMRVLIIVAGVFFFAGLCGCQPGDENPSPAPDLSVASESGNMFPEFLVGTWEANNARWILTFEPDGSISSFTHFVGMDINVDDGGLIEQWRKGSVATYILGPCEAEYTPATRQLDVTIIIKHFNIDFPNGQMKGNFVDYLRGPVSEDGKQWTVDWLSYCTIEEAIPPDPNKIMPRPLIFKKIRNEVQGGNQ